MSRHRELEMLKKQEATLIQLQMAFSDQLNRLKVCGIGFEFYHAALSQHVNIQRYVRGLSINTASLTFSRMWNDTKSCINSYNVPESLTLHCVCSSLIEKKCDSDFFKLCFRIKVTH